MLLISLLRPFLGYTTLYRIFIMNQLNIEKKSSWQALKGPVVWL